jgi:glycosyltransferase involved in cell wall biosynthesis
MHFVSLQQAAGVEAHFAEFVRHARVHDARYRHGWVDAVGRMHPIVAAQLAGQLDSRIVTKRRWGVRLPAWPRQLRSWHTRRELERARADVLLIWNRTARAAFALDAMGAERCIHWEHGAAWHPGREAERQRYFARVPLAIANSNAAARVLRLMWNYRGTLQVCRNALRPSLVPPDPVAKRYPRGPITLGCAARLYPVKGVALAVRAVAELRAAGADVKLQVAGEGPELEPLRALAATLGLAEHVTFLGALADMAAFYRRIDCLLHTPLTEAFGLVALEAAAHGCPVIAAAVDGLPEAVADGISGYTLPPTLPVDEYVALGGSRVGLPERVYSPERDALVSPGAVAPTAIAAAVARLFGAAATFEALSESSSRHVLGTADFATHVGEVLGIIDEFRGQAR